MTHSTFYTIESAKNYNVKKLSIDNGSKLAAYSVGDMIMLKPISIPTEQDFRESLDEAAAWAKEVGYEQEDVNDIVKSYRKANRT